VRAQWDRNSQTLRLEQGQSQELKQYGLISAANEKDIADDEPRSTEQK
jgi:hypothetical protein